MKNNQEFVRVPCTKENPYKYDNKPTFHPDAKIILNLDYSDWYKCPYCSLEFKVELPE